MRMTTASEDKSVRAARLYRATALGGLFAFALVPTISVFAQPVEQLAPDIPSGSQMLLEADTLVYDNDQETVTAVGGVQIDYAGNRLVAQRVSYDQRTGRLVASGNVEIIERGGNKINSEQIDITDDFKDGFVNALRVETPDKTYFAAESAVREGGTLTTFRNGVYTACEPCEEKPDRPPIWRIKARKIIWNGAAKTVRFESPRFEFFGFPIAYLPFFEMADPTVKRKTGFLMPGIGYRTELGASVSIPYYIALAPTYDLTLTGTGYTKQGFMGEAEWRQQFDNGQYNLKMAGIQQRNPEEFEPNKVDSGPDGDPNENRGMIGTSGKFKINPRWSFGWSILAQSDKNFSSTYGIEGFEEEERSSEVYLTGLNKRNYFDLRFQRFQVQEETLDDLPNGDSNPDARNPRQAWVLPSFDYAYTPDEPIAGGELNVDVNAQLIHRSKLDYTAFRPGAIDRSLVPSALRGVESTHGRITAETEWKRSIITDGGLVFTPLLHGRGDAIGTNLSADSNAAILSHADFLSGRLPGQAGAPAYSHADLAYGSVDAEIRSAYYRAMATAGLEMRWPILFSSTSSSHILEPMAQIFARPNAAYHSSLGIPNEDAQSLVFDATSLFERDKFSGYDRIEGGTRANVGIRYSGSFANGWSANGLFGQSYHLAGDNPYASPDLVNAGAFSGLETDRSDFVGMVGLATPGGLSLSVGARFDEEDFDIRRTDLQAGFNGQPVSVVTRYTFIEAQPLYGFANDRREITVGAVAKLHENWSTFGSGTYDFETKTLVSNALGFSYADECFIYSMTYAQARSPGNPDEEPETSISFNISFRTLGEFGSATNVLE